jgi:hypothetical protein
MASGRKDERLDARGARSDSDLVSDRDAPGSDLCSPVRVKKATAKAERPLCGSGCEIHDALKSKVKW